ncbi:MAG: hypothetical protein J6D08_01615 [Lachnospiraceae bacterium]|nr:hypothetical protein [Lachnospiraceae bacterium]
MIHRRTILRILCTLLFVILFNAVFFLSGGTRRNAAQWLGYAFIHISYAAAAVFGFAGQRSPELDTPLNMISEVYFGVDFVVSLLFILAAPDSVKAEAVVQIALLAVYLLFFTRILMANDATVKRTEQQNIDRKYIMDGSSRLKGLMDNTSDRKLYKQLEKAYDVIHASPAKSSDAVIQHEFSVLRLIGALEQEAAAGNTEECSELIQRIIAVAGERNYMLRGK